MRTARRAIRALEMDLPEAIEEVAGVGRVRLRRPVGVAQERDERVGRAVERERPQLEVAERGCERV